MRCILNVFISAVTRHVMIKWPGLVSCQSVEFYHHWQLLIVFYFYIVIFTSRINFIFLMIVLRINSEERCQPLVVVYCCLAARQMWVSRQPHCLTKFTSVNSLRIVSVEMQALNSYAKQLFANYKSMQWAQKRLAFLVMFSHADRNSSNCWKSTTYRMPHTGSDSSVLNATHR